MKLQRINLNDECWLLVGTLSTNVSHQTVEFVERHADWTRRVGRWGPEPRDTAMYGYGFDSRSGYRRSIPVPSMPGQLEPLLRSLEEAASSSFNAVLLNRYVSGRDSVDWHHDLEPHIVGSDPIIASVSLGATRTFAMKPRDAGSGWGTQTLDLAHGDVLVMCGKIQHQWLHRVPKTRRQVGTRWNLTFRRYRPVQHG